MNKENIKAALIAVIPGLAGAASIIFAVILFLKRSYFYAIALALTGILLLTFVIAFSKSYIKDQKLIKVLHYEKDPQRFLELTEQNLAKTKNPVQRCLLLFNITVALRYLGRFREALSVLDNIAPTKEAKPYTKMIINCYADLCICIGEYDSAKMHLENLKAHMSARPEKPVIDNDLKKSIDICYTEINIGRGSLQPQDDLIIEQIKNEQLPIKQAEFDLIIAKYCILKNDPAARFYLDRVIKEAPKMYISQEAAELLSGMEAAALQ